MLPDADVQEAMEGTFAGTMYNHGQNCSACTRVFVHSSLYNQFVERLAEKAKALKVGPGLDPETEMGPLVSQKQLNTVLGFIEKGKEEGARLVAGGNRALQKGFFVQPTIFADVQDTMTIAQEEIFGPVMSILSFETIEEVIVRANNSKYGLAASIWTENVKKHIILLVNYRQEQYGLMILA